MRSTLLCYCVAHIFVAVSSGVAAAFSNILIIVLCCTVVTSVLFSLMVCVLLSRIYSDSFLKKNKSLADLEQEEVKRQKQIFYFFSYGHYNKQRHLCMQTVNNLRRVTDRR